MNAKESAGGRIDGSMAPVSFAQERLLFLHLLDPADPAYNVTVALDLRGPLDVAALRSTVLTIAMRHEALRTTFRRVAHRMVQDCLPLAPPVHLVDLTELSAEATDAQLQRLVDRIAARPVNLLAGPAARWIIVRTALDRHVLLLAVHHIVFDGASLTVVAGELELLYEACRRGLPGGIEAPQVRQADLARAERARADRDDGALRYWRERLDGVPARLAIFAPGTVRGAGHRPVSAQVIFDADRVARLRQVARRSASTLNMVLTAGLVCLLGRYSGRDDIVLGSPVSTRDDPALGGVVGMFVNLVPLRVDLGGDPGFADVLVRVRDAIFAGLDHRAAPFERVVAALRPVRTAVLSPIFQVQVVYQQLPAPPRLAGITARLLDVPSPAAKYELSVTVTETGSEVRLDFEAGPTVCDQPSLARLAAHAGTLLEAMVADPGRPVSTLPMLGERDRIDALVAGIGARRPRPAATGLHGLVREQALRTPDAVAVVTGRVHLSYRALVRLATRLAGRLSILGVGPECRVGILLERSAALPAALLGVLQTGAAYLPLDPVDPPARLAWMLSDAGVGIVVTSRELRDRLPAGLARVLDIDADVEDVPVRSPPAGVHPEQAAYVIYTSGSTGRPKGVVVPHRGIVNRLLWMQEELRLGPHDRVLHKTPLTFDVSVWELFWPLLAGACLVLARPGGHRDPGHLLDVVADEQVSTTYFVPSLLGPFLDQLDRSGRLLPSLRLVVCSGEVLPSDLRDRLISTLPARLVNLYGPTEASVDVTVWPCGEHTPVRIGTPIANVEVHVLDGALQPLPPHVAGELCIAGIGLARGYLNRPALTARAFLPNPLGEPAGSRLYLTGDRARRCPDTTLQYLGRLDTLVKIAGNRIELAEIEEVLRRHPVVADCAVTAPAGRLVGYVVPRQEGGVDRNELTAHLRTSLPSVMVPAVLVVLDELPRTPAGKLDRRALPAPTTRVLAQDSPSPPRNRVERLVAEAWCAVLGLECVGIHDNFFDAGGSSLLLIELHARLQRDVDERLTLERLLRHPTVAALAESIAQPHDPRLLAHRAVDRARRRGMATTVRDSARRGVDDGG